LTARRALGAFSEHSPSLPSQVLAFDGLRRGGRGKASPLFDGNAFWRVVTRDASPAAGAHADCIPAVRATWEAIDSATGSAAGRAELSSVFRLCEPLREGASPSDAEGGAGARLKALPLSVSGTPTTRPRRVHDTHPSGAAAERL